MRTRSRVVARVCRRDDLEKSTRPTDVIKAPLSGDLPPAHRSRTSMTRSGAHRVAPHARSPPGGGSPGSTGPWPPLRTHSRVIHAYLTPPIEMCYNTYIYVCTVHVRFVCRSSHVYIIIYIYYLYTK